MKIKTVAACLVGALLLVGTLPLRAGAPDWLRAAARMQLPDYPDDPDAVVLLNEQITTVKDNGEIKTRYRRAYKILRPEGRPYGTVVVFFDNETRLTYLKAWSLPPGQKEYEVKEKDSVESSLFSGALYQDTRSKTLRIPGAEPGNVIGYEYEQKGRPFILQDTWWFAARIPVRRARYLLEPPAGWEFDSYWLNHPVQEPRSAGKNQWVWELKDIPAIKTEPAMPSWRAVAGRLAVNIYPSTNASLRDRSHASWEEVGHWFAQLARAKRQATPEIREKVTELTAGTATLLDKIKALADFVQRDIRYVAIEIGIGGYQPHPAQEVFTNRYGDCKDKTTLLSTMLQEIGVESHYVLINTTRGVATPEFPSALSFNHAILALRLPEDISNPTLYSVREHGGLGRLLFFDPTDPLTPLGYLPSTLQANYGLLVREPGGELLELPLLPPNVNRLYRQVSSVLEANGKLTSDVTEIRSGTHAVSRRAAYLDVPDSQRPKVLEDGLGFHLGNFELLSSEVENLEEYSQNMVETYRFVADKYAKSVGNLLLVRPRVLGQKGRDILEKEARKYPVEFRSTSSESGVVTITLPAGYIVDELPPPTDLSTDFGEYHSRIEVEGNVLRYQRSFVMKDVQFPIERFQELKEFYRQIAADERNQAVLKESAP